MCLVQYSSLLLQLQKSNCWYQRRCPTKVAGKNNKLSVYFHRFVIRPYVYINLAVDCVLSDEWSEWSDCDVNCDSGVKQRTLPILVAPANGGKSCGTTVQRALCEGVKCKHARASGRLIELKGNFSQNLRFFNFLSESWIYPEHVLTRTFVLSRICHSYDLWPMSC